MAPFLHSLPMLRPPWMGGLAKRWEGGGVAVPVLIALLVLLVLLILGIGFTMNFLALIVMLIVAGIVGWLADLIVPGELPYGWLGAIVAGLVGAWLGTALIGQVGPTLAGIPLLPALLGAIIIAFLVNLVAKAMAGRRV